MFAKPIILASLLLLPATSAARTAGLTIKPGETWVFNIFRGQPSKARRAAPTTNPAPGQVVASVRTMMGTSLTISSNNPNAYTFQAQLIGAGKAAPARSCTLPANAKISFEHWPQKAAAVRLSDFKPALKGGSCP